MFRDLSRRYFSAVVLSFSSLGLIPSNAQSEEKFPTHSLQMLIPYGPGAASDVVARIICEGMSRQLGQAVIPINRPGATGLVAVNAGQSAPADGYTVLFFSSGIVNEPALRKGTFDFRKDLFPVGRVAAAPLGIFVSAKLPVNSSKELIDYARQNPGKLTYASPGVGSVIHLNTERLRSAVGIDLVHVPYPAGTAPVLRALMAGEIDVYVNEMGSMRSIVTDKRAKVLATLDEHRSPLYPEAPSSAEIDVPELRGFNASFFYGIYVKPGTSAEHVDALNSALNKTMRDPTVRERLIGLGYSPASMGGLSSSEFRDLLSHEFARMEAVVRDAKIPTGPQ